MFDTLKPMMDNGEKKKNSVWLKYLLEVSSIFKTYDINYFLDMGTMLGAVRNEDFISWDNDIDLGLLREKINYLALMSAIEKMVASNYDIDMARNHIGLRKNGVEINIMIYEMHDEEYQAFYVKYECFHSFIKFIRNVKKGEHLYSNGNSWKHRIKKTIIDNKGILKAVPEKMLDIAIKETVKRIVVPKIYFENFSDVTVRGNTFPAPKMKQEYLKYRYGPNWLVPQRQYKYFEEVGAIKPT
jgi:lipopolysaccharide cholinephosphotransferase